MTPRLVIALWFTAVLLLFGRLATADETTPLVHYAAAGLDPTGATILNPFADAGPAAAPAPTIATPDGDSAGWARSMYDAVKAGRWLVAAGLALLGLVWALRALVNRFAPDEHFLRWLLTDRGGVVLTLATAFLGELGTGWAAGRPASIGGVMAALGVAWAASGGWSHVRRLLWPQDREPETEPQNPSGPRALPLRAP